MEVSGQLHILAALPQDKSTRHPEWATEPVWTRWRRETSLPGIEPRFLGRPAHGPVIIQTEQEKSWVPEHFIRASSYFLKWINIDKLHISHSPRLHYYILLSDGLFVLYTFACVNATCLKWNCLQWTINIKHVSGGQLQYPRYKWNWYLSNFRIPQNYKIFGLCPSSSILKIREHNVSETGSVSVLRSGG
jgi:hypothetical protein